MDSNEEMKDETSGGSTYAAPEDPASPRFDNRPWGSFTVLDEGTGFKVKRLEVLPGKRLSYQYHAHRVEHWVVVKGSATITLDGFVSVINEGETADVPVAARHRIENAGSERLILIEIQRGSYLGEDDIVRLEDDFHRI
jgi:mannose-6-phosphate isomerase